MRHVSDRFTAMLDANVLYPFLMRDVLLSLAAAGLYRVQWTEQITAEWLGHLQKSKPQQAGKLQRTVETMRRAFPEAIIDEYEALIPGLTLPDPDDRHVLAAAIKGGARDEQPARIRTHARRAGGELGVGDSGPAEGLCAAAPVRRDSGGQAGQTIVTVGRNGGLAVSGGRPLRGAFGYRRLGEGARIVGDFAEDPGPLHGDLDDRRHQDQEDDSNDDSGRSIHG
jgi:hypothetical protein